MLNVDKRPVLEFGIIRSVIGFESEKMPKSCSPISKDCTVSHSGQNERLFPHHLRTRCVMGYLKTRMVDGIREKGLGELIPQVDWLR